MSTIDLLLPGIFDRLSEWLEEYPDHLSADSVLKALVRAELLPRQEASYEELLWALLFPDSANHGSCKAPFGGLAFDRNDDRFVCRADPVHLYADVNALYLQKHAINDMSDSERSLFEGLLNEFLFEDGIEYRLRASGAGYLHFREPPPPLLSNPPSLVLGRDIFEYRPRGGAVEDTAYWTRLQSELQMLLFSAPVNQAREAEGRSIVNSLWLWGGSVEGEVPRAIYSAIYADDCTGVEAAESANVAIAPYARFDVGTMNQDESILLINTACLDATAADDFGAWSEALVQLDNLMERLLGALRQSKFKALRLFDGRGGSYRLSRTDLWRLWRRQSWKGLAKKSSHATLGNGAKA
ncbi:MAG: hypothetical protein ACWA5X_09005 [bacterium]